ncbi:MAG: DUF4870 domain-containing protein [Nanoarchaeota archaeon]
MVKAKKSTGTKKSTEQKRTAKPSTVKKHSAGSDNSDNLLAMLAHLLGIFTGFIGALVIFIVKNDEKGSIVRENAKHALNFQFSLIVYSIISGILVFVIVGIPLLVALSIFALVAQIVGSIRAFEGNVYSYPLEIHFLKN